MGSAKPLGGLAPESVVRTRPTFGRIKASFGRTQRNFGRLLATVAQIGPNCSKSAQLLPMLAKIGATLADLCSKLAGAGPSSTKFGRTGPIGQILVEVDPSCVESDFAKAVSACGRIRPNFARFRSQVGRHEAQYGRHNRCLPSLFQAPSKVFGFPSRFGGGLW